jgi:hypothetical protein
MDFFRGSIGRSRCWLKAIRHAAVRRSNLFYVFKTGYRWKSAP